MSSKLPPVPDQNRSAKGTGDRSKTVLSKSRKDQEPANPDKRGQQGNTKVNTTHQGYQQDR